MRKQLKVIVRISVCLAAGACLLMGTGCSSKKKATAGNFKKAIGDYYNAHPECVWSAAVKFPVEADPNKGDQTSGYDALTDAGLLTRTSAQKKVFIFGTKQVNDYDVSDKGRSTWTPDPTQPGYGNFCYGHREVTSVDHFVTSGDRNGQSLVNVDYHYRVEGVAGWANSQEMRTAFPVIQNGTGSGNIDKASLVLTDDGWQVSHE